jgi:hypothetical protein
MRSLQDDDPNCVANGTLNLRPSIAHDPRGTADSRVDEVGKEGRWTVEISE